MPSVQVTPALLIQLAHNIKMGEIKTLKIGARVSGKNKGQSFADYTLKDAENDVPARLAYYRQRIAQTVTQAAQAISIGENISFKLVHTPDPEGEKYAYTFEAK